MARTMTPRMMGMALIALSASSFGSLAIFARFAYDAGTEPIALLCVRFSLAGAVMLAWMIVAKKPWPTGKLLRSLVLLGGLGYVGQSFSFFTALTLASASLVALLLYLHPALVTLLAAAIDKERIDAPKGVALVLALAGSALVVGVGGGGEPLGIFFGVMAAVIYAVYIVAGSKVTPRSGAVPSTAVIILTAAVFFAVVAAVQRPAFPEDGGGWAALAGVALASVVAIVSFFEALARLGPSDASTLSTIEPVVTVLLAWVVLGEALTPLQLVGGMAIIAAVVVLARHRPKATSPTAASLDVPPPS